MKTYSLLLNRFLGLAQMFFAKLIKLETKPITQKIKKTKQHFVIKLIV